MPGHELKEGALAVSEARAAQEKAAKEAAEKNAEQLKDKEITGKAKIVAAEEATEVVKEDPTKAALIASERAATNNLDPKTMPESSEGAQKQKPAVSDPPITPITKVVEPDVRLPPVEVAMPVEKTPNRTAEATGEKRAQIEAGKEERQLIPDDIKKATETAGKAAQKEGEKRKAEGQPKDSDSLGKPSGGNDGNSGAKREDRPTHSVRDPEPKQDLYSKRDPEPKRDGESRREGQGEKRSDASGTTPRAEKETIKEPKAQTPQASGDQRQGEARSGDRKEAPPQEPRAQSGQDRKVQPEARPTTPTPERTPPPSQTKETPASVSNREAPTPPTAKPETPTTRAPTPRVGPEPAKTASTPQPSQESKVVDARRAQEPPRTATPDKVIETPPKATTPDRVIESPKPQAPQQDPRRASEPQKPATVEVPPEKGRAEPPPRPTQQKDTPPPDRKVVEPSTSPKGEAVVGKPEIPTKPEQLRRGEETQRARGTESKVQEERAARDDSGRRIEQVQDRERVERGVSGKGDVRLKTDEGEGTIPKGRITERVKDRLEESPVVKDVVTKESDIKKAVTVSTSSTGGGDGDAAGVKAKGEQPQRIDPQQVKDARDVVVEPKSVTKEELKLALDQVKAALEKGTTLDPKLLEIIQQANTESKNIDKPAIPVELAKNFEDVATPQMTKQEAMQALLGLLVDAERMSNVLVNEIKVDTEVKLGQIQSNIDEVLKLRVEQFIALSVNQNGVEGVDLQNLLHESLNELATRYGLTEEQRMLLSRIMVAVSTASFEQDDLLTKQKPEDKKEIDAAKLKELKLREELRLREATPEEIEKYRQEELEDLKKLLRERDELKRAEAEQKLKDIIELNKMDEEVTFMIDEDLEVIKTYKIVGIVIDRETGRPIPGISIVGGLLGTRTTDSHGMFEYKNVPQGTVFMIGPDSLSYTFKPPFTAGTVSMGVHLEFRGRLKVH